MDLPEKSIDLALQKGAEFADVRIFRGRETDISMENTAAKIGGAIILDINFRVFMKGNWGTCSGNDLTLLPTMVDTSVQLAKTVKTKKGKPYTLSTHPFSEDRVEVDARIPPDRVDITEKMEYLHSLEQQVNYQPIKRTNVSYKDVVGTKSIHNSQGANIEEEIMYTCFTITAVAKAGDRTEIACARKYSCGGYELAREAEKLPPLAAQRACDLLETKPFHQGTYDAVLDPILVGTLFHEVLGHCCEADLILQGTSALKRHLGSQVAPEDINVWDDPTLLQAPVHYHYDDEGVAAKKKPLISHGVLNTYLHSLDSSSQMEDAFPGNGRCQDYSCFPLVRMSNTYVTGDESDFSAGLFLKGTLGGQVEPGTGQFFIRPEIGEFVQNGTVKKRAKNIIVVGSILDLLRSIKGVGGGFDLDSGTCEKEGQVIMIGSGGNSVEVSNITVVGG